MISRHLASTQYYTCASPRYLAERGVPDHPSQLESHPYLAFRTEHSTEEVKFDAPDGTSITMPLKPTLSTNNIGMVRECALAGLGIATLSAYLVDDDIEAGRLVRLLPDFQLAQREFRLVYANRKFLPLKVKAFIDLAVDHFRLSDT
jgi:DNA-binding transcriptional LysR family regulator